MAETDIEYGIVYLLTNPAMPGLVKIGMTTRSDLETRMKELYSTGVPVPFECQYACRVKAADCARIEKAMHTAFAPQRVNANREFFKIEVEQAKAILVLFNIEDMTKEVADEISNDLTEEDRVAKSRVKIYRPPLNFIELGMKIGDKLIWKDDSSVYVTVSSERRVMYNNEEVSLSVLSAKLKGYSVKHIAAGGLWLYEGRLLGDMYDEVHPMEE